MFCLLLFIHTPVKLKVGRKTLPSGSSSGSHLTINEARYGLVKPADQEY